MDPSDLRALATDAVVPTDDGVVLLERDHPPHEEARRVDTFDPEDPPAMGFDHGDILADAVSPR